MITLDETKLKQAVKELLSRRRSYCPHPGLEFKCPKYRGCLDCVTDWLINEAKCEEQVNENWDC